MRYALSADLNAFHGWCCINKFTAQDSIRVAPTHIGCGSNSGTPRRRAASPFGSDMLEQRNLLGSQSVRGGNLVDRDTWSGPSPAGIT